MYWMKPNWLKKYFLNLAFFLESYVFDMQRTKRKNRLVLLSFKSQQIFSKENIGHVPHCIRFRVIQRFAHSSKELAIKIIKP